MEYLEASFGKYIDEIGCITKIHYDFMYSGGYSVVYTATRAVDCSLLASASPMRGGHSGRGYLSMIH